MLELQSFNQAIRSLKLALDEYKVNNTDFIRDSCIQRFEYTYELSWKMLKRYLETTSPNPAEFDEMSFQNLIRTGNEKSLLLSNLEVWKKYRVARGTTSHTYNNQKALEVFSIIPDFLKEAQYLLQQLEKNNT